MSIRSTLGKLSHTPGGVALRRRLFPGTADYWENRYAKGGTSGAGSYGRQAEWKAEIVNG